MAAAPIAITALSTAMGMAGAKTAAAAQQQAAEYSAQTKQASATQAVQAAAENERRQRMSARAALGGIRANVGASGITTEGSALDVLQNSASNAELDSLTIRHKGDMEAWALNSGAQLDIFKGQQAVTAGEYQASAYLLKGISGAVGGTGGGGGSSPNSAGGGDGGEGQV